MAGYEDRAKQILRRLSALEQRRVHFEYTWDEIAEYISPRNSRIRTDKRIKGERYGESIYDSTAPQSAQIATDGTQGHMVSSSFRWLNLIMRQHEEDRDIRDWLQETTDALYYSLNPTNFYEAMNEFIHNGWTLGTAVMYIDEDVAAGRPVFRTLHTREPYIAEDKHGTVDTVYRVFELTARQAVQLFGEYDESVVRQAEKTPDEPREFVHAVEPRARRDTRVADAENMPFMSCYVDRKMGKVVSEGGYNRLPYAVWRFRKNSDEEYGRSPAWDALRDTKVLNEMVKAALTMAQKAAQPIRYVPEEYRNIWQFIPNVVNYYRDPNRPAVVSDEVGQYPVVIDFIQNIREQIRQHFWVDFWQMMNANADRSKTATEVVEMQNEKLAILTSSIGRFQNEALNPILDNVFEIEFEAGRLPEAPPQLAEMGGKIEVDYVGPLSLAIRRLRTQGTQQAIMQVAQIAQLDPNVLMHFKLGETAVAVAEAFGMDQDLIRDEKEVQAIVQAQQQAQQAQMAAAQQAELMRGVDPNRPVEKGSVLSEVMGR